VKGEVAAQSSMEIELSHRVSVGAVVSDHASPEAELAVPVWAVLALEGLVLERIGLMEVAVKGLIGAVLAELVR